MTSLAPMLLIPALVLGPTPLTVAAPRLEIRIYRSVAPGVSPRHARAYTKPMLALMEEKLGLVINNDLAEGESADDLQRFGGKINGGSIHLAAMWGLEYAWLRNEFKRLVPLVVCSQHETVYVSQFIVGGDSDANRLADLEGKKLATFPRASLMDRVYLHELLERNRRTVKDYFRVTPYRTPLAAIQAVNSGDADCIVLNYVAYGRYATNRPGFDLRRIEPSDPFPGVVLVGRRDLINKLRPGLWEALRETLETIHLTKEGQQCVDFWRVQGFKRPDDRFEKRVRERLQDYPIRILSRID